MFQNRIQELIEFTENSIDKEILKVLRTNFNVLSDNSPFVPFNVPGRWDVLRIQKVAELIDTRLFATKNADGTIQISM